MLPLPPPVHSYVHLVFISVLPKNIIGCICPYVSLLYCGHRDGIAGGGGTWPILSDILRKYVDLSTSMFFSILEYQISGAYGQKLLHIFCSFVLAIVRKRGCLLALIINI